VAPIGAGTWHLVGDGEDITKAVDVRFDIVWRATRGSDTVLATASHHFDPPAAGPGQFDAVEYETDVAGIAAPAVPGDQLVLRFTVTAGSGYIPNGDGALVNGRIPNLTLP